MRTLNVFVAASILFLAAPLHAASYKLATTADIDGVWTAQVSIRGQIPTVGSFTEAGTATCEIQSESASRAGFVCNLQNATTPLSDGHLTTTNQGKKLRWNIDSTTNIEADVLGRVIAGLQAKGKSFDPNAVVLNLTSESYKPFKVYSTSLLANGKAVIKGRAIAVINGKRKSLKFTYTISPVILTR